MKPFPVQTPHPNPLRAGAVLRAHFRRAAGRCWGGGCVKKVGVVNRGNFTGDCVTQGGFLPPSDAVEALGVSQQVDEEERLLLAAAAPTTTEEMHPKALMTTNSIPVILGVRRVHIHNEEVSPPPPSSPPARTRPQPVRHTPTVTRHTCTRAGRHRPRARQPRQERRRVAAGERAVVRWLVDRHLRQELRRDEARRCGAHRRPALPANHMDRQPDDSVHGATRTRRRG